MPYAPAFRSRPSLQQPIHDDQLHAVYGFAGLYDLRTVLAPNCPRGGYPDLLLYATAVAARVFGSQARALRELRRPGLWADLTARYGDLVENPGPFPAVPPTARQQDAFADRLCADPRVLAALSDRFSESAVAMARDLGQFPDGVEPDFAQPDPRHLVVGDGTYVAPFSAVTQTTDMETGEIVVHGSRSKYDRPRIQGSRTDATLDGKRTSGVNFVTVSTPTDAGWVILASTRTLGAEVDAARDLLERLHHLVGGALHTVVWDRALTGWTLGWIMARFGVDVVNKDAARDPRRGVSEHTPLRMAPAEAIRRFQAQVPLPLGTAVYETTAGHDVVTSRFRRYGQLPDTDCPHELWVDDGALCDVTVTTDTHHLVKRAYATATRSVREREATDGYRQVTTWTLPCTESAEHTFTTTWTPSSERHKQILSRGVRTATHRALSDMRVIPRGDARFGGTHGRRNSAESYHSWLKATLGTGVKSGRAMRLSIDEQFLDHLCAGTLANALTDRRANLLRR